MYYPIILLPSNLNEYLLQLNASALEIPPEPVPPYAPGEPPKLVINFVNPLLKLAATLISSTILCYFCYRYTGKSLSWALMLPTNYFGAAFALSPICKRLLWYRMKLRRYKEEIENYEKLLERYKEAWAAWAYLQARHTSTIRRQKIQEFLAKRVTKPKGISNANQGYSEAEFKKHLEQNFPGKIDQGIEMPVPNENYRYSADFVYSDGNLRVDIEIDEPYYYITKAPTHVCDRQGDKKRNQFFLDNGWIIIRFAEEQVVRWPESCCKEIAKVIVRVNGEWSIFNEFKDVPELTRIKHWSVSEAKKMAKANFRDTYLPEKETKPAFPSASNTSKLQDRREVSQKTRTRKGKRWRA